MLIYQYTILWINEPLLLKLGYFWPEPSNLWNMPKRRNVGGHCPTKVLQSRFPARNKVAETRLDATAAQYQTTPGAWSGRRKYWSCMLCAVLVTVAPVVAMSRGPFESNDVRN